MLSKQEFEFDFAFKYGQHDHIFEYIYDNKFNEKYDNMMIFDINSNLSFVTMERDTSNESFIFARYYNLKDSIPSLRVFKTGMKINDAIELSTRRNMIKGLESLEDKINQLNSK